MDLNDQGDYLELKIPFQSLRRLLCMQEESGQVSPPSAWLCFSLTWHVIVQVCGYRLRLHFDGYSDCHDFWVNANSPDVHPAGWCESTGHKLHTPKGQR